MSKFERPGPTLEEAQKAMAKCDTIKGPAGQAAKITRLEAENERLKGWLAERTKERDTERIECAKIITLRESKLKAQLAAARSEVSALLEAARRVQLWAAVQGPFDEVYEPMWVDLDEAIKQAAERRVKNER